MASVQTRNASQPRSFRRATETPVSVKEVALRAAPAHRYRIGEEVTLSRGFGYARVSGVVYEITALLPPDRAHFLYRIRSGTEPFTRVAAENELTLRPRTHAKQGDDHGQGPAAQPQRKKKAKAG